MKRILLSGAILLLTAASCALLNFGRNSVYPKRNNVPVYDAAGRLFSYVQWGEKLTVRKTVTTNTNRTMYLVQRDLDRLEGYVASNDVVAGVVTRGVILNTVLVYDSPSMAYSRVKQNVFPPVLVYVLEIRGDGFAEILPYDSDPLYQISPNESKITGIRWVQIGGISTNVQDVEVVLAVEQTLCSIRQISPGDTNLMRQTMDSQVKFLEEDLPRRYGDSPALIYAKQALDILLPDTNETVTNPIYDDNSFFNDTSAVTEQNDSSDDFEFGD